jgi:hypothetical protein
MSEAGDLLDLVIKIEEATSNTDTRDGVLIKRLENNLRQ